jgi:carbohydrate kinase (thermoresistant glucokinase family)
MGVSGSGKTTVGRTIARRLGWPFQEGDDFHPQANIDKMKSGRPLNDDDRAPWLSAIAGWIGDRLANGENGVITSSALKRSYREVINPRHAGVVFVFLHGSRATIAGRLESRGSHFMPAALLQSQLDDLEPPADDEQALSFDVAAPPDTITQAVMAQLGLENRAR